MHIRNSCPARAYYRILEKFILPGLMRLSIAPNHFTFVGLVLAIFVPFGFYVHPVLGFIFIILSGIADSIDGMMARNHGMDTNFGSFLDSSIDRISDFFYLFGFWTLFWNYERIILASSLVFLSFLFTAMISYVKAKAKE